jgi:tRNA-splicing ligase RtcB
MTMGFKKIDECTWEIEKRGRMRVPARFLALESALDMIRRDQALDQLTNVAQLPGIVGYSLAMPDIHWGYGFPIGGVAAFDLDQGVISPGGVGYDINCGVRLMRTKLDLQTVKPRIRALADALFSGVPCGVGSTGAIRLTPGDQDRVLSQGAAWTVKNGYGEQSDLEYTEERGCLPDADPDAVSRRAKERGRHQLGTLGSGNHFLEVGLVDRIFDETAAAAYGLREGGITVMIHSGSRGLGYQVCDDYLKQLVRQGSRDLPDRQLACAPIGSAEARDYMAAMACATNYAFANRQAMSHLTREIFQKVFQAGPRDLGMGLVYDVCHNIAKKERHSVQGKDRMLMVHRKGATRAFGPGRPEVPSAFRAVGQPVLIPGDMGSCSYVLAGTQKAMETTFGSTCHGAGRVMSRTKAKKAARDRSIAFELSDRGIHVRAKGKGTLAEEMPEAYKNVEDVVEAVHRSGISRKVARLVPLAVIKG